MRPGEVCSALHRPGNVPVLRPDNIRATEGKDCGIIVRRIGIMSFPFLDRVNAFIESFSLLSEVLLVRAFLLWAEEG